MTNTVPRLLNGYLEELQKKNSRFSLRSFAKKVSISPGRMHELLNGKRELTEYYANRIIYGLKLESEEARTLLSLVTRSARKIAADRLLYDSEIQALSSWEYFAILNLLETKNFQGTQSEIASRLGLPSSRTNECLKTLIQGRFIEQYDGHKYRRIFRALDSEKDIPSSAIREFHFQHLKKASEVLQTAPVEKRDFTTMTIPVNMKNLKKAKKYISDFQDRMALLLSEGETTEVYDLTIQLFPLTQSKGH